ncbi:NUDIX hydrolase [Macrococcus sp. EM39E]|uniref:NUDIX hydrolase n=1 Tax=Macrococcus animalis TaxID=3395467 RepID=UPI0039BE02F4
MIKYICANLVEIKDNKLLLVKVRDNEKYYLPGGKIETGESDIESLTREMEEELSVKLDASKLAYLDTIIGPAYPDTNHDVELRCYTYEGLDTVEKSSEITDVQYMDMSDTTNIAPAVQVLIQKLQQK